ncbi:MAG: hypothetical protein IJN90_01675 [Bacilli bacterium]|nr:hypothetical protein [Bacilli bacterium]
MSKYFKEVLKEEKHLSEYEVKDAQEQRELEYLIEVLGDVPIDEDMKKLFHQQFHCFGGRYSVRTKPETIKGVYDFTRRFPELTKNAIDEIWFRYIDDTFEKYDMKSVLDKYLEIFGKEDETFELFIGYVEKKAEQEQEIKKQEAHTLDELKEEYGEKFTTHLKSLVVRQHKDIDEIKKYLPSAELIRKDEEHILDLSRRTRIFFGCCEPVSYTMFDILLEEKTLDTYTETPTYYISTGRKEQATFTKTDFLESIKKEKTKTKK